MTNSALANAATVTGSALTSSASATQPAASTSGVASGRAGAGAISKSDAVAIDMLFYFPEVMRVRWRTRVWILVRRFSEGRSPSGGRASLPATSRP